MLRCWGCAIVGSCQDQPLQYLLLVLDLSNCFLLAPVNLLRQVVCIEAAMAEAGQLVAGFLKLAEAQSILVLVFLVCKISKAVQAKLQADRSRWKSVADQTTGRGAQPLLTCQCTSSKHNHRFKTKFDWGLGLLIWPAARNRRRFSNHLKLQKLCCPLPQAALTQWDE